VAPLRWTAEAPTGEGYHFDLSSIPAESEPVRRISADGQMGVRWDSGAATAHLWAVDREKAVSEPSRSAPIHDYFPSTVA